MLIGNFSRHLVSPDTVFDLKEISYTTAWEGSEPNNDADEPKPIDSVWISKRLEASGFNIIPFGESVGNYSTMIFDTSIHLLIGEF